MTDTQARKINDFHQVAIAVVVRCLHLLALEITTRICIIAYIEMLGRRSYEKHVDTLESFQGSMISIRHDEQNSRQDSIESQECVNVIGNGFWKKTIRVRSNVQKNRRIQPCMRPSTNSELKWH